jgi:hypothetical protein
MDYSIVASKTEWDAYMIAASALRAQDSAEKDRALTAITLLLDAAWEDRMVALDREAAIEGQEAVDF